MKEDKTVNSTMNRYR